MVNEDLPRLKDEFELMVAAEEKKKKALKYHYEYSEIYLPGCCQVKENMYVSWNYDYIYVHINLKQKSMKKTEGKMKGFLNNILSSSIGFVLGIFMFFGSIFIFAIVISLIVSCVKFEIKDWSIFKQSIGNCFKEDGSSNLCFAGWTRDRRDFKSFSF